MDIPSISLDPIARQEMPEATRASSGKMIERFMLQERKVVCGSCDLSSSNNLKNTNYKAITAEDFSGNFIHYGVRENAMAAIMNGLALSSFVPIGGTFFVFSDYMKPSIRLSALMGLPVIYVMTHDSIGVGEDGPTHQPIEHLASFRAMPNIDLFRPADLIETQECYEIALSNKNKPSMMVLSRQKVPQIRSPLNRNMSSRGGYVISEAKDKDAIDIVIFATGSEVSIALEVQKILQSNGRSVRICSVPSFDLLYMQGAEYVGELKGGANIMSAIEAASSFGWHKIIGSNGVFFGLDRFGESAPAADLYRYFNLTPDSIASELEKVFYKSIEESDVI